MGEQGTKRKVIGSQDTTHITSAPTKVADPKKEEELDVTTQASSYSVGLNKETVVGGGILATIGYGIYNFFSGEDEQTPRVGPCEFDENNVCLPMKDEEGNPITLVNPVDEDGNPIALVDEDGNPIVTYAGEGDADAVVEPVVDDDEPDTDVDAGKPCDEYWDEPLVGDYSRTTVAYSAAAVVGVAVLGGLGYLVKKFWWTPRQVRLEAERVEAERVETERVAAELEAARLAAQNGGQTPGSTTTGPPTTGGNGPVIPPVDSSSSDDLPAPVQLAEGSCVLQRGHFYEVDQNNQLRSVGGAIQAVPQDPLHYAVGDSYVQKNFRHQNVDYVIVNLNSTTTSVSNGGCCGGSSDQTTMNIVARDTSLAQDAATVSFPFATIAQMEDVTQGQ